MTTPKKNENPTNGDIIRELRKMNDRVGALENWKLAEDAAKKAVAEYRRQEELDRRDKSRNKETLAKSEVLKQLAYVLGLIGLGLYVYLSTKGIHP